MMQELPAEESEQLLGGTRGNSRKPLKRSDQGMGWTCTLKNVPEVIPIITLLLLPTFLSLFRTIILMR